MNARIAYRQQFTRCGKQRCRKCKEGEGHGPYWYAYWSENGRTRTKYIGVHLPPDLEPAQQDLTGEEENAAHYLLARATPTSILRVYLLGQFYVEYKNGNEWRSVDPHVWQHRRVRSLLSCLLSSANRRLSKEQVMKLLWPDLDRDIATNRLNGVVHELRHILEPGIARPGASRMLRLKGDMLELADSSQIWVDGEAFEQLLHEANTTTDAEQAEHLLEEADALYKSSYLLEELYSEWASQRRDVLQQKWAEMLLTLANLRVERGALVEAIATLDRLRSTDPLNETALQRLMVLLTQLYRRGEALRIYRQLASTLKREYECDPLPETHTLYNELRQGRIPPEYLVQTGKTRTASYLSPGQGPTQLRSRPSAKGTEGAVTPAATSTSPAPPCSQIRQEAIFVRPALQLDRHHQYPLIGRQQELEGMRHILQAASSPSEAKHPHFLLLTGESGIGKTRLAEELSSEAYAQGWAVAWHQANEQERHLSYRPWTTLLRTLLHASLPYLSQLKLERLAALLPEAPHHTLPSTARPPQPHVREQEQVHVWDEVLELLSTLCQIYPLLFILDDLQWADDESIDLLGYLIHHLREQGILLIATCRDEELVQAQKLHMLITDMQRKQELVTLAVQPLTSMEIGTLLAHLPLQIAQSTQAQAAGNPFFAQELARLAGQNPSQIAHPLPETITALFEHRLRKLSHSCQACIEKAALLGEMFELDQLLSSMPKHTEEDIFVLLEEALHAKFLREEGTAAHIRYHFCHPLLARFLRERRSASPNPPQDALGF
jgi:DNA-binding SARP family transcriptional activator